MPGIIQNLVNYTLAQMHMWHVVVVSVMYKSNSHKYMNSWKDKFYAFLINMFELCFWDSKDTNP